MSGAAALLLQKSPELHHHEIKSLLLTTAEPVSDAFGDEFSIQETGAGRLNIAKAFDAKLIIEPPNFVGLASSDNKVIEKQFQLKSLDGTWDGFDVRFDGPEFIKFSGQLVDENILNVRMSVLDENFGEHEGKIRINHGDIQYVVPFVLHYTPGSVSIVQQNEKLLFDVYHPEEWSFAKISITNTKDGRIDTTTATPDKTASINVYENAEYWVDAKIRVNENTSDAFNTILVNSLPRDSQRPSTIDLPERQIIIISASMAIIGIVGLIIKRR